MHRTCSESSYRDDALQTFRRSWPQNELKASLKIIKLALFLLVCRGARWCACTSSKQATWVISVFTDNVFIPSSCFLGKLCLPQYQTVNCNLTWALFKSAPAAEKDTDYNFSPEVPCEFSHSKVQHFRFPAFLPTKSDLKVQLIFQMMVLAALCQCAI